MALRSVNPANGDAGSVFVNVKTVYVA